MLRAIFQSTLPRGERLAQQYEWDSITVISIHAPTRGATERGRRYFRTTIISIHAPTRGATPCRQKKSSMQIFQSTLPRGERPSAERLGGVLWDFNPRSHEGSDLLWSGYRTKLRDISIHAPTRGATPTGINLDRRCRISIHAPTRGATRLVWQQVYLVQ